MSARKPLVQVGGTMRELLATDTLAVQNFGLGSTSLYSGGVLSINADTTKIDISAGVAVFMNYTDPAFPVATALNFGPFTAVSVTNIATSPSTYIGINSAGTVVQQTTVFTAAQRRSIVPIGIAIHTNNVSVNLVNQVSAPNRSILNQMQDLIEAVGPLNMSGNVYAANAGANLTIDRSAGQLFKYGSNFYADTDNPHTITTSALTALTFRYRQANSVESADTTNIVPNQYDNAGVLTNVPNNSFTIQRIFMFQSGATRIQYGQTLYSSLANALAAISTESFTLEANIAANGVARGVLIVKGNATNLTLATDARFVPATKFGAVAGAGASALAFSDIVNALGYTPANDAGDTFTGDVAFATNTTTAGFNRSTSKEIDATAALTAKTLTKQRTYLTGAGSANITVTFPAASAAIDGQIMMVMMVNGRPAVTWASSGATFVGAPGATNANQPYSFQYDHATLKWYAC